MTNRLPRDEITVSTKVELRGGWTTPADITDWAVIRPLKKADLDGPLRLLGDLNRRELMTSDGTAKALVYALEQPLEPWQLYPLLGHLLRRGVVLAPLCGLSGTWHYARLLPEMKSWVEQTADAVGLINPTRFAKRVLANLYMATAEGRKVSINTDIVRQFVDIHLISDGRGKWLAGISYHLAKGLREIGAHVGANISKKWSPLSEIIQAIPADVANRWRQGLNQFYAERHLSSIGHHEHAFKTFMVYLSDLPQCWSIDDYFSTRVGRPSLIDWLNKRFPNARHRNRTQNHVYDILLWFIHNDDSLITRDEHTSDPIIRPEVYFPFKASDIDKSWSSKKAEGEDPTETVQRALPTEYLEEIEKILFDNDMEWSKKRSVDWIDQAELGGARTVQVYCPVLPYLIALLIKIPIRQVQARRLDSGEGDALNFNADTNEWGKNYGSNSGHWERARVARPNRGVLRKIEDGFAGRTLCGLFINSNKTSDRKVLFDERSGYVIQWQNDGAIDIIQRMRRWQEKHNPVAKPLAYIEVRPSVFQKSSKEVAERRPDVFYLFRYPAGNAREYRTSPPSGPQLRMFWYEVLAELQKRMQLKNKKAPDLISRWQKGSPQASPYTLHGLRHAGLTRMAMSGVHPWILQNIVAGHAAWIMTLYYIKPNPAHISDTLNEAYVRIMSEKQEEFRQFLSSRTIEEVHRATVAGSHGIAGLQELRASGLKSFSGHLANVEIGICPNGRTRCDEGVRVADRTEYKHKEAAKAFGPVPCTVGGAPDCARCRFFITGTPFIEGLRVKVNEVSLHAHESGIRYNELRKSRDDKEASYAIARRDGKSADALEERAITVIEQTVKAEADVLAELVESLHAHVQLWQKVRAIAQEQSRDGDASSPALTFDELPEFRWELQPRFQMVDELCHAAKWFPSIRTTDLRRERREAITRLLVRNRRPPALALMTETEADVAAGSLIAELHRKWGKSALRKIFDDQNTFESLGLADGIDAVLSNVLGPAMMATSAKGAPKLSLEAPGKRKSR